MAAADALAIAELRTELSFKSYADMLVAARGGVPRVVQLFLGPPNSGKTYEALRVLEEAPSGAYLAPLRLLALEVRDELAEKGVACDLVTGEDCDFVDGATHASCTIECLDTKKIIDTVVIDEAQMLFDGSRGWAWTNALLSAPCRELIVICAPHAEAAVRQLLRLVGETPSVRAFARKCGTLTIIDTPIPLDKFVAGDAVVSFSRMDALVNRDTLLRSGRESAVIYGALPPDVRRCEAARFADGSVGLLRCALAVTDSWR